MARIERQLLLLQAGGAKSPTTATLPACDVPVWTQGTLERVLISAEQIDERVAALGAEISAAYNCVRDEEEFVVVGLLSGCFMFMADLTRHISVPHRVDFVAASSYGASTVSSSNVKIKCVARGLTLPPATKTETH